MLHTSAIRHVKSYQERNDKNITFVQSDDEIAANFEMLKIVHQYNQQHGWTLLLAPDHVPSKDLLDACSIDTNKLLVIRKKHLVNLEYVLNSALHNGRFAAIITWTDIVSQTQLDHMSLNSHMASAQLYCFVSEAQGAEPQHINAA